MKFRDLPDEIHEVIWMLGTVSFLMGITMVIGWMNTIEEFGLGLMASSSGWLIYKISKWVISKYSQRGR